MEKLLTSQLFNEINQENYKRDETIEKIVDLFWDERKDQRFISLQASGKSDEYAEVLRTKGNACYGARDFKKALELYNLSIMAAPHPVLGKEDMRLLDEITGEEDALSVPRIDLAKYGGMAEGESSHALAKGFANRSAVLLELKFYEKCLVDIDLALEYGYPRRSLRKLEDRRQKCREALLKKRAAGASEAKPSQKKAGGPKEPKSDLQMLSELMKLQLAEENPSLEDILSAELCKTPKLADPNPKAPSLSSTVAIDYEPLKGRGIFARRDIRPGEILAVERSFAVGIDKSKLSTFCSTCAYRSLTPLPCPACSEVMFCSKSCRARGLAEDHWLDCKLLKSVNSGNTRVFSCAYKMLKTYSHQQLQSIVKDLDEEKQHLQLQSTSKVLDKPEKHKQLLSTVKEFDMEEQDQHLQSTVKDLDKGEQTNPRCVLGVDKKGVYRSESYRSFYHVCHDPRGLPPNILRAGTLGSFLIGLLLEESARYFVSESGEPVTPTKEDIVEVCKFLTDNITRKYINCFNMKYGEPDDFLLFSTLSLINHACYPTASMVSYGRESVLVATRPIRAGEEVTIAYNTPFYKANKAERHEDLRMHDFVCKCEACEGNWPTIFISVMPKTRFRCLLCQNLLSDGVVICSRCKSLADKKGSKERTDVYKEKKKILKALQDLEHIRYSATFMNDFNKEDYLRLCEISDIIHRYSAMPCERLIVLQALIFDFTEHGYFRT